MEKYVNGGIVKEMTIHMKDSNDISTVVDKLGKFINLDLYDMKVYDNAIFFDLNEDYIKENLVSFLKEINSMNLPSFIDYSKKTKYISDNLDKSLDDLLENCDDLFKERFRCYDTFSINDDSFYIDVLCYVFYFDGPYENGYFEGLLQYLHMLHKKALSNPLKNVLCFGINS